MDQRSTIAYFTMEIGLVPDIPTYVGGLGVLAGDSLRAAADLGLPIVGVTLLYRKGYFRQELDAQGRQTEHPAAWSPNGRLRALEPRVSVPVEGRKVVVRAWEFEIRAPAGRVPVLFLDTDLEENDPIDRRLTDELYGGDHRYRLCQEIILGIAGRRMLRALGYRVSCFHMNEGHAFLLTVELLSEHICDERSEALDERALRSVRSRCVFTTHTPIPAGHDRFAIEHVRHAVGDHPVLHRPDLYASPGEPEILNTTRLAMNLSRFSNAVAKRHAEVTRAMFPDHTIAGITNGVHAATWVAPPLAELFDRRLPGWREDNAALRGAVAVPGEEYRLAHARAKLRMIREVVARTGAALHPEAFTICFARRSTAYKRPDLLLHNPDRLRAMVGALGPLQVIYAGKAHPRDTAGKETIRLIFERMARLLPEVPIAYVPDYDIEIASLLVAGSDLWLNNPEPPLEASGTSGMKAALNGVPSLSVLDGWWIEGCYEGVTGWAIGEDTPGADTGADRLYEKLERAILPVYFGSKERWTDICRHAIALNGSYFTTQRMMREYAARAYFA